MASAPRERAPRHVPRRERCHYARHYDSREEIASHVVDGGIVDASASEREFMP